ncbi:hypothetical protein V757_10130 [Pelistega indica]|uniref:Nucleotidyltransferase n=1 Tax=Pelistega indica TaxID=1414851 RepID=V8FWJ0_9BURK|nr:MULTISPECIES: HepT-like ribonuclease domain-containing protein [Pelistega]ETD68500.1 hypothetical protein V757_10130 [Pelistega indica]
MKRSELRIDHCILDIEKYASLILEYVNDMTKEEFLADIKTLQAVTLNLIYLGEISTVLKNDYPKFLEQASKIEWKQIAGMRHQLVHGYFNIKEDLVWMATQEHIPNLLNQIPYLKEVAQKYLMQSQELPESKSEI